MLSRCQLKLSPHGLTSTEQQQRAGRLGDAIDRDVDERLGLQLDVRRQRQEQDLARGLVHRVAQRLIDHPGEGRRPEGGIQQHHQGGRAHAERQDEERETDPEIAMNLARQPDLDDERDRGRPERDLREEGGDGVRGSGALCRCRGHVQLLLDDGRADRGKADDERDDLQMLRLPQQRERLGQADAFLLFRFQRRGIGLHVFAGCDVPDQGGAHDHQRGADQQQICGSETLGVGCERGPRYAAERRAAADEPEQPLRLARVVDEVGDRPELADQQHAHQVREHVERGRRP